MYRDSEHKGRQVSVGKGKYVFVVRHKKTDTVLPAKPRMAMMTHTNCPECGGRMARLGSCFSCLSCGWGSCEG